MPEIVKGFEKQVTDELVLRIANSEEEGHELAEFNEKIHGEGLKDYVERVYFEHPSREKFLWFYIKNITNNVIVSAMTLLPLKWQIRDHEFLIAEMGFVGTAKEYRGRGFFGIMNDYYDRAIKERDFVLSSLVGIPYFYRRYGYEFALSQHTGFEIPTNNIPSEEIEEVKIRKATDDDLEFMEKEYNNYATEFAVSTAFEKEKFQFRMMNTTADEFNSITYIVEEDREPKGFFTIGSVHNSDKADIILVSKLTNQQMIKILQFVKTYNRGTINSFMVTVDKDSKFAKFLKSKGADAVTDWTWQVKIPELLSFFKTLKPILEERIAESIFKGLTQKLKISDYTETISLEIEEGKIVNIERERGYPSNEIDLRIPSPFNTRLFLSDRSVNELNYIITDTLVSNKSKLLVETLFPKLPSLPFSYY